MADIAKILCAVDFSSMSPRVADYSVTLAKALNVPLHLVYVAPTLRRYGSFAVAEESIESFVAAILAGARETMDEFLARHCQGVEATGSVEMGYAPEAIVNVAKDHGCGLIVMGTHGRRGIDRIVFGSVAEKVVKSSPLPVLTIHPEQQA